MNYSTNVLKELKRLQPLHLHRTLICLANHPVCPKAVKPLDFTGWEGNHGFTSLAA